MRIGRILLMILALAVGTFATRAQDERIVKIPDYAEIEKFVVANPDAYKGLLTRFLDGDTTMTFDELHLVYYGFPFTNQYNPMYTYDELKIALNEKDPILADSLCNEAMKECAVSLRALMYPLMLHRSSSDPIMKSQSARDMWRISSIMDVMLASGESDETSPLYTIFIADEYALLDFLGLPKPKAQYSGREKPVDTLVLDVPDSPEGGNELKVYFDITPSRQFLQRIFR